MAEAECEGLTLKTSAALGLIGTVDQTISTPQSGSATPVANKHADADTAIDYAIQLHFRALDYQEKVHGHEVTLVSSRMTWFCISQTFLVTAAVKFVELIELRVAENRSFDEGYLWHAAYLFCVLGIVWTAVGWAAVMAANRVKDKIEKFRGRCVVRLNGLIQKLENKETRRMVMPVIGSRSQRKNDEQLLGTKFFGFMPTAVLPPVMLGFWILGIFYLYRVYDPCLSWGWYLLWVIRATIMVLIYRCWIKGKFRFQGVLREMGCGDGNLEAPINGKPAAEATPTKM